MEEISAGGVVIHEDEVLILKKYRGDWVLPKGRLENGETWEDAALREVYEESGVQGDITRYIGFVKYVYNHTDGAKVKKTVHYYLMKGGDISTRPQKEEGFCDAVFLDFEKAVHLLKHDAEKNMVKKAIDFYLNN